MEYEIKYRPAYSLLVVKLSQGERITAEAGAMTYMDPNIEVETTKREQGILSSLGLALIGGQSFFVNHYIAPNGPGEMGFVSAPIGDIQVLDVNPDQGYIIQKASYVASDETVDLDIKWEGFTKGLFGQGLFMIRVSGQGKLFINTFGAIDKHVLEPGKTLIVDNFHLVAFSSACNYKVTKFGGLKETILGGEGFVTRITGPGEIYLQTKNLKEFADWLWVALAPRTQGPGIRGGPGIQFGFGR